MSPVIVFTAIVIASLVVAVVCLNNLRADLSRYYWLNGLGATFVAMTVLSGLAWYNLFFYAFVSFVIIMGVREASKCIFLNPRGGIVLGIYFGLWLSLPMGMLQLGT